MADGDSVRRCLQRHEDALRRCDHCGVCPSCLLERTVSRRDFCRILSVGGSAAYFGAYGGLPGLLGGAAPIAGGASWPNGGGNKLRQLSAVSPSGLTLRATEGTAEIGGGVSTTAWMLNNSLPSPLLRVRRGDPFRVTLQNELRDELILHWHGLTPPEHSDGHPRFAIYRGSKYEYDFTVENRAGTYWYHSHAHHKVGKHTAMGIAGMLIVEDEEEDALGLPSGEREIPIVLQDRLLDGNGRPMYINPNLLAGHMGSEAFGNGIHRPYVEVDTALYRLRILNGSNARIFHLERSDGRPLVVIGNDGGLLERPHEVDFVYLAPAERIDLLVDLSSARVGDQIMLRSRAFTVPGGMEHMMSGGYAQGLPMDLLQLRVSRRVQETARIPETLLPVAGPDPADAVRERLFHFSSDRDPDSRNVHERHLINGQTYEMDRIDERVPFDQTEIWTLKNDNAFAHPVHLHATHFRVLSRSGGRDRVMPWEEGLKDTVLLYPTETVRIAVRFTAHKGLFVLHCHNLEHEDVGMMMNVMVE